MISRRRWWLERDCPSAGPLLPSPAVTGKTETLNGICRVIGEQLHGLAHLLAVGLITEKRFTELLLQIESKQVSPHGFVLTASNTIDNWTVFKLRVAGCEEACAQFEFRPETGEFREPGSGPP